MDPTERLKRALVDEVTKFEREQLSQVPKAVEVDVHADTVVITLSGVTCPAEREYARDAQSRDLLDRVYGETYRVTKPVLESAIQHLLGRCVERSRLDVDPESGDGTILVSLRRKLTRATGDTECAKNRSDQ